MLGLIPGVMWMLIRPALLVIIHLVIPQCLIRKNIHAPKILNDETGQKEGLMH